MNDFLSPLKEFINKKIAILGFGIEGQSTLSFLQKQGITTITILDKKTEGEFPVDIQEMIVQYRNQGIVFTLGGEYMDNLASFDIIIRSPGISSAHPDLVAFKHEGHIVTSSTQLFFDFCPAQIIGVTGTKGKGTTTTLIAKMLEEEGKEVFTGGNIGVSPFSFLNKLSSQSLVVLELSSFQLHDLTKSPHIAVVLMITSEHLDYHATTEEYVDAKRNILRYQTKDDFAIINRDYLASNESDIYTEGEVFYFSTERTVDQGCFIRDDAIWIKKDGNEQKIIETKNIALIGRHNWENACAAAMAATLAGSSKQSVYKILNTFKGLEHRLEFVTEMDGVSYYNDSFSTTPETTIAAIESFDQPEILILGGSSKQSDFTHLGEVIRSSSHIKAIIGIGEEWKNIKSKINAAGEQNTKILFIEHCRSMAEIVIEAKDIAEPGDVILLSPGCASFDMFKNYKDRGEQFKKVVERLTGEGLKE